ncbi:MAG: ornithine acetyltransferase, partial [Ruminococcaceae bacterium]|nr:ornithine acetyltransferase [Oscillospiraceae bacterium]
MYVASYKDKPDFLRLLPDGSITSPAGFRAAGIACGLKKSRKPDLALVVSDSLAQAAGVFTRNVVQGHSLQLTRQHIAGGTARALVINSGNANACVGRIGMDYARSMASQIANLLDCQVEQVLTGSTGVIGHRLDMTTLSRGINLACDRLENTPEAGHKAGQAILTTDTFPKACAVQLELGGQTVTVAGMAKGSGMIHP